MKRKLLVICGPTAVGKTSLALRLAKKFGGELISADSRQVYKRMDIGTGKDLPNGSKLIAKSSKLPEFYNVDGIKIWGYDLVEPTEEFSVGQYIKIARKIIENIWSRNKLPILVGGTGLYIKGVVDGIGTVGVPKNIKLRKSLEGKNADELFNILTGVTPVKAASMNASDKKNPRRLIRAIEVAYHKDRKRSDTLIRIIDAKHTFSVGLKASREYLAERIEERVDERVKQGIEKEIKNLLEEGVGWNDQSMQALGYKQWKPFFQEKITRDKVIDNWKRAEKQYAKRQMTWFKKDKRIKWFDITKSGWKEDVENTVSKWYKKTG